MAAIPDKDTIYIDIDDEITAIIDKVKASDAKILALVLPKRATVLQSIVNMKLLKRSADNDKKHLVLVTSEAGLLPLAGAVGLYVAKTPQSKPEIPVNIDADDDEITDETVDDASEVTVATAGSRPVGELAAGIGAAAAAGDAIETLQMDDDPMDDAATAADVLPAVGANAKKPKKNKKLAVPNFDRFRLLLALGIIVIVLLGVGFYLATAVLPKGTITITTDTSSVNSNLTLNLDTTAKTLDASKLTVPATNQSLQKTGSQQAPATGKKNLGTPSKGNVTLVNCSADSSEEDIPAGTGVSTNGQTYITQNTVRLATSTFDSHGNCKTTIANSTDVAVIAQNPGSATVSSGTTMTVAGFSTSVTAKADGDITGGTDDIVQVLAQSDIDTATQKIVAQNSDAVKQQLQQQLQSNGLFAITSTFTAGTPTTSASANVGDQVSTVTVTEVTTYTMFGVKQADLKTLVDNDVRGHIDSSKQSILNEGLSSASFKLTSATATTAQIALSTTATAGPDLKTDAIKSEVAGKKSGDIQNILKADPGVSAVQVHFSPFWVTKAPSKPAKLTVIFQKSDGTGN